MPWENICSAPGTAGGRAAGQAGASRWRQVSDCALGCELPTGDENLPAAAYGNTGFRLRDGALETLGGQRLPRRRMGRNHKPGRHRGDASRYNVRSPGLRAGAERDAGGALRATDGLTSEVERRVTGYNL